MAKKFSEKFYKSKQWQKCREDYARSVGGLCEECLEREIITAGEIVHHKIELTPDNINRPEITLNWENLRLVCRECHAIKHGKRRRRYAVDEFGKVQIKY